MITKHATRLEHCRYPVRYYDRARDGMYDFLQALRNETGLEYILLPSYIGFSPKDGSGVYDPVEKVDGLKYAFYHVDLMLQIDIDSVKSALDALQGASFILLRMDYYGFTDQNAQQLYQLVHEYGGLVLEDNAHSIPYGREVFGYFSDACFHAMHKILPLEKGGMMMLRSPELSPLSLHGSRVPDEAQNPWVYDFGEIGALRRANFLALQKLIASYSDHFTVMRTLEDETTIPYSFPVILKHDDRFALYNYLNDHGFGVTCLYYAIIAQIPVDVYPESKYLSDHILNFSVHQDVDSGAYRAMLDAVVTFYEKSESL